MAFSSTYLIIGKVIGNKSTAMQHFYQKLVTNRKGDLLFASSANTVLAFEITSSGTNLLTQWTDEIDPYFSVRKHHKELLQKYEYDMNSFEKQGKDQESKPKKPKMPIPGPGAPPTFTYIRGMRLSRNEKYLIILTDNDKAAVVFEIQDKRADKVEPSFNLLLIKRQPFNKRPSAVTTSLDDTDLIVSDKFGDVFSVPLADKKVADEKTLAPMLGHVSMLTCIDMSRDEKGRQCVVTSDRDEHIRVSYYPKSYVIKKWLFGHEEFVSSFVLPEWCSGKVIISAGGDHFICSWLWQNNEGTELVEKMELSNIVEKYLGEKHLAPKKFQNEQGSLKEYSVSEIIPLNRIHKLAIIIEQVSAIFIVKVAENGSLQYDQTIETAGDVINGTASDCKLVLSLVNNSHSIVSYNINDDGSIALSGNQDQLAFEVEKNRISVANNKDTVPLFTVGQLRKRREH